MKIFVGVMLLTTTLIAACSSGGGEPCVPGTCPPTGQDAGASLDGSVAGRKRIFTTSEGYTADLKTAGSATTGIAGADNVCNATAAKEVLGGNWRAWISDSNTDAIDRIIGDGPWFLLDGAKAFNNKSNLSTSPLAHLDISETGALLYGGLGVFFWSGTGPAGNLQGGTCVNWTDPTSGEGKLSSSALFNKDTSSDSCQTTKRLLCIEQ